MYSFVGVGLVLYFASQGTGGLLLPVLGNLAQRAIARIGDCLALCWTDELAHVFVAQSGALLVYGA